MGEGGGGEEEGGEEGEEGEEGGVHGWLLECESDEGLIEVGLVEVFFRGIEVSTRSNREWSENGGDMRELLYSVLMINMV